MPDRRAVIFLSHADPTALRLAGSCALAVSAVDASVDVYLFGAAVPAVVSACDGEPDDPAALLHQARAGGHCRLVACSASLVAEKVQLSDAERAVDAVVGWPTVVEWSRGIVDRFFF
ncbi:MAG TPA: hypothetical protein VLU43_09755 [Anaeromyxobacteraceae bacterium]|nr:hypothetical protein [Anaeromyxobacteraceae bacterium]